MKHPDLKQYAAEMQELEKAPPAPIELPPLAAIAIISHIQLASRHPGANSEFTEMAIDVARQLQELFNRDSTVYKVLEMGWNPDCDLPISKEMCIEPCQDFLHNRGCRCTGYKVAEVVSGKDVPPEILATGAALMEQVQRQFSEYGFVSADLDEDDES